MSATGTKHRRVAVIGAGVIGLSWTALFLDHGLEVVINDPDPDVEPRVRSALAELCATDVWEARLRFEPDLASAVSNADLVQENGPDRLELKRSLWQTVEHACPADTLLLSSSSGLTASRQSTLMTDPGRLLVGHPFNPPHILPLVEVVPGATTPPGLAEGAIAFYAAIGKHPVLLDRELPGFVANRLQAAFLKECMWIVRSGAATPAQIDEIVTHSLGPRWAADGPFASAAMGGGPKGFEGFLDHFAKGLQMLWLHSRVKPVILFPWFQRSLVRQVARDLGGSSLADLEAARDDKLRAVLATLARTGHRRGAA